MRRPLTCRACDAEYNGTSPSCDCHETCKHCGEHRIYHTEFQLGAVVVLICPTAIFDPKARL